MSFHVNFAARYARKSESRGSRAVSLKERIPLSSVLAEKVA